MKNKLLTALLGFFTAILIITFSIGLPIYVRPFYYMQMDVLEIEEYYHRNAEWCGIEGHEEIDSQDIKDAFNDVMDYLTLPGNEFGTGKLAFSEEGKSHFEDCKALFDLNISAFIISLFGVAVLLILNRRGVFQLWKPFGMSIAFCSGAYTLGGFVLIGGLCAIDFDKAFEVFHTVFFPGKDNWLFNPITDQIILILPQDFFMNCAILILASIILLCLGCIAYGLIPRWREKLASEE